MKHKLPVFIFLGISLIFVVGIIIFQSIKTNMNTILEIELSDINLIYLEDGMYEGAYYQEEQIGVTVFVTIKDHEITDIEYENHITGLGQKSEDIKYDIISNQSIMVDDIAGATTSSRCIKLAIMDALNKEH